MNHTELQGRDGGCVIGLSADRRQNHSLFSARRQPAAGFVSWHPGTPFCIQTRATPRSYSNTSSNGFCSCNCIRPRNQGMDISELEFLQITIILLLMTFMTVVIICLLNHYWLPALAFLTRLSHVQRDQATQTVMCGHLHSSLPPVVEQQQQPQLCRFQPTYPYLHQEGINFPPVISLSDGEEPLPYKGPCSLQLRHPEQQLELSRATVCAPPNRTVFDSELLDIYLQSKTPQSPNSNSQTSTGNDTMQGPPPSYSEVMGDHHDSTPCYCQNSNKVPPKDNRSGRSCSLTVFHSGNTAKASTNVDS
ncbi:protein TMEPAI-like isoform X2 [Channa argus]|uniref:protein TMEPAI-like isoform X2 n=1 Tax=Channa argus TaxID=215402 RepID=UPI00351F8184